MTVVHLVVGPDRHGVCAFGVQLAELMRSQILRLPAADLLDAATVETRAPAVVHLQYTDRLFGTTIAKAVQSFEHLCESLRRVVPRLTATLHDLPDPLDDPARFRLRSLAYARVVAALDEIVVGSRHEARRLRTALESVGAEYRPVHVVPLPVHPAPEPPAGRPRVRREVAVFGFVYPGKGHDEVLRAIPPRLADYELRAVGGVADGHHDLARDLARTGERIGRRFGVEGYVPEAQLIARLRRSAVPVVPGARVSASGSANAWLRAGRRPLMADGDYARELAARFPGAVRLYRPDELPGLLVQAVDDPDSTWTGAPLPWELTGSATGAAYRDALSVSRAAGPAGS